MAKAEKGAEYVCGTTLLITEIGCGTLQDMACRDMPMVARVAEAKMPKAKPKKKEKRK